MVTASTTRPLRMSSPSFLRSQLAKDCKIWSALQAHGCPAGVQRLPGEGVHLPGTSCCSQPGSARLILLLSPSLLQLLSGLGRSPSSLCSLQLYVLSQVSPDRWFTVPSQILLTLIQRKLITQSLVATPGIIHRQ